MSVSNQTFDVEIQRGKLLPAKRQRAAPGLRLSAVALRSPQATAPLPGLRFPVIATATPSEPRSCTGDCSIYYELYLYRVPAIPYTPLYRGIHMGYGFARGIS
eukprot:2353169-Pleurochrysis_carterae.AAC.1